MHNRMFRHIFLSDMKYMTLTPCNNKSSGLETKNINHRGWIMDILNCVNKLSTQLFSLEEMYLFEDELQIKHPQNNNIKPKIRQQLQFLRDKGFIEFLGNGKYRKII